MASYSSGITATLMGGSGRVAEGTYANYSKEAAHVYMKKHGNMSETVAVMFRYDPRASKNMKKKVAKAVAASAILNETVFEGCEEFNQKIAEAMHEFEIGNTALVTIDGTPNTAMIEGAGTSTTTNPVEENNKTAAEKSSKKITKAIDKAITKLENLVKEDGLNNEEVMTRATKIITNMATKVGRELDVFSDPKVVSNLISSIIAGADTKGIIGEIVKDSKAAIEHPTEDEPVVSTEPVDESKTIDAKEGEYKEEPVEEKEFDTSSKFIPSENDSDNSTKAHPIIFHHDKMDLNLGGVDEKLNGQQKKNLNKIKDYMSSLIPDRFKWEVKCLISGMMELDLFDNGAFMRAFIIDPNLIQGNGFYMLAPTALGQVSIPFARKDLIQGAICGRVLTKEEHNECTATVFENGDIYAFIDMSGIGKFNGMKSHTYRRLGDKLNKVLVTINEQAGINPLPRFRFKEFNDNDNFILIADGKVRNPMNFPAVFPTEDIIVTVSGVDIEVAIGSNCVSFRMK